jgi:hypothetical protein
MNCSQAHTFNAHKTLKHSEKERDCLNDMDFQWRYIAVSLFLQKPEGLGPARLSRAEYLIKVAWFVKK